MQRTFLSGYKSFRNSILFQSGILYLKQRFRPRKNIIILGYHALKTPVFLKNTLGIGFGIADFVSQIKYIAARFNVISMEDFLNSLHNKVDFPENTVMITFDDGYRDVYELAMPILNKYGLSATVFVSTGHMGNRTSLWTNLLYYYFYKSDRASLTWNLPDKPETLFPLQDPTSRRESILRISGSLKQMDTRNRETQIRIIREKLHVDSASDPHDDLPMLDWSQVKILADNGFHIGSHSCTHPILSRCAENELERELSESKSEIESRTGRECRVLAYPNGQPGDYDAKTIAAVTKIGYSAAFTFHAGLVHPNVDPYRISRHPIFEVPLHTFALGIS